MAQRSSAHIPTATAISCPCCGGPVARVQKGLLDRLLEPFRGERRRYRCKIVTCGWTSSERVEVAPAPSLWMSSPAQASASEESGPRRPGFRR